MIINKFNMYHMKNIISFEKAIDLPKCMYSLKNPIEVSEKGIDIKICEQVTKFLKKMPNNQLLDLEERQDKLLHKLDILYERIKSISSLCTLNTQQETNYKTAIIKPEELVLILNCQNLPWFLNIFLKRIKNLNVSWHIHSTVPSANISKIESFFKTFQDLYKLQTDSKVNLRLIFKGDSAESELKLSTLGVPVLGTVNIIRYLCLIYNVVPYDYNNYEVDSILDVCYEIENISDKNKQALLSKLFTKCKNMFSNNNFSIVDLAAFNIVKQLPNGHKNVPEVWLSNCEKIAL